MEGVQCLVQEGKVDVNKATLKGHAALYIAAKKGYMEVVWWLIEEGKADVNQTTNDGKRPLFAAAHAGYTELVQWLVHEGKADINQSSVKGTTPLLASLQAKVINIAVPRFLLSIGASVSSIDNRVFNGGIAKA
jgi:ankyrin repeat protein